MKCPLELTALTKLFDELGASDPERWARSQVEEGIPQLARFLFLRQAWRSIVSEDDTSWIYAAINHAKSHPDKPYAGAGLALARLKAKGATDEDLTDLVRAMQAELLFNFCYLLSDPGDVEDSASDIAWKLMQVDDQGTAIEEVGALHESVLGTDPTGRQIRPRPVG